MPFLALLVTFIVHLFLPAGSDKVDSKYPTGIVKICKQISSYMDLGDLYKEWQAEKMPSGKNAQRE